MALNSCHAVLSKQQGRAEVHNIHNKKALSQQRVHNHFPTSFLLTHLIQQRRSPLWVRESLSGEIPCEIWCLCCDGGACGVLHGALGDDVRADVLCVHRHCAFDAL
eukprot:gnl/MRDRNA2_/MRDRNA2_607568_c0_seq1.p2 gnl/MRDRNA2_/MRDRNA2_607568_c0~~gnl/MRDRNA2_/MRDRNA2_607568_c0_seq1.p2  ORF type:complete len:106 (-),score=14.00 gnl/MRDRNA2_/MRDRNA2_607568_c0_seq1:7-324(-)